MKCLKPENLDTETRLREPQNEGTTFLRTCLNGSNTLAGVGILSVPYALSQGGWLSLILLFLIAACCFYTGLLLKRCMDVNPLIKTYPDIGYLAFGRKGRAIVSTLLYLEIFLVAVEFLIMEGDNLHKLFPYRGLTIAGIRIGGQQCFVLLTALVVLPTTWLRSLGLLAYVSVGGVLASVAVVFCVFWAGAVDGVGFHERGVTMDWGGIPTSVSIYMFCYCGHSVFPTLCNSMKDRGQFPKVLLVCFLASSLNYASMAVIGYLMYGDNLESQVTLNLPVKKLSTQIAIFMVLVSPITKYAVVISPLANAIEDIPFFRDGKTIGMILRKTGIVIGTVVVAVSFPFFGYVMAFMGAFLGVTVSILLPCLCYLKIRKFDEGFWVRLTVNLGIVVVGLVIGTVGTYTAIKQIVDHLRYHTK